MDNKILGYTKVELLVVIVLLGVVAFITINKTSYAFEIDKKEEAVAVNDIKKLIEMQAEQYALDNVEELFSEGDTNVILVADLVQNGYMIGNSKGQIMNPTDSTESYNENKIDLTYDRETNKILAVLRV